jgi:Fe-S-cluster containining protein
MEGSKGEERRRGAECLRCGRCCRQPFAHQVSPDDLARWGEEQRYDLLSAEQEERRALDDPAGGLLAWRKHQPCRFCSTAADGRTACDIYSTRPRVCRLFIPGRSRLCSARI